MISPVTPAELDWMEDALYDGASAAQLAQWQAKRFENPRTALAIQRIAQKYGLRPGHIPKTETAARRLSAWAELKAEGAVWIDGHIHPGQRPAMRWLVRTGAAHLFGHKPGKGLNTREYRDPPIIYLNEEYKPWTPWSN